MNSMLIKNRKGFTLVEIMIVVVIIGLLAAMAIPAFNRVRANSISSAMDNDARQIASAAQQYFLETGLVTVPVTYTAASGAIGGALQPYVRTVGKNYTAFPEALTPEGTFVINHALVDARTYTAEGVYIPD